MAQSRRSDCWRGIALALWLTAGGASAAAAQRDLVLWTADDCGWCKVWKQSDRSEEFLAAAAPLAMRLITVRKPQLSQPVRYFEFSDGLQPWPIELRPTLLPAFDFVCNGRSVKRLLGVAGWDSFWHQSMHQLARECPDERP